MLVRSSKLTQCLCESLSGNAVKFLDEARTHPELCESSRRVLFNLLRFATQRRAVLGAIFLDCNDSFGHFDLEAGLSGDVRASG